MTYRNRTLDWKGRYDPRSRNFAVADVIGDKPLRKHNWRCESVLDQGREGACVGFGWSAELVATPKVVQGVTNSFALDIYNRAKQLDEYFGEDYEGTSVLAGVKAVQEHRNIDGKPLIGTYHWAFGVKDILLAVSYHGPVVLGITWYENMYDPDENNFIHVGGQIVGGHCILLNGFNPVWKDVNGPHTIDNLDYDLSTVKLHNSWGQDWGNYGEAYLSVADLHILIEEQDGEACVPAHRVV